MFKNNECVGSMVSGAVIGVAVGMLVERVLSPRSVEQPANKEEPNRPVCCENVKKRSDNLQVSSHHLKNHGHSHHRRSKSASRPKNADKPCNYLSVTPALHRNTKTSVSETDLRSRSAEKSCSRRKLATKIEVNGRNIFFDPSTEYLSFRPKAHKNLRDKMDGGFDRASGREAVATASTEYIPFEPKNKSERSRPALLVSKVNNPRADLTHSESTHGHVDATFDLEDKLFYPESYHESIGHGSTENIALESKNKSERCRPALLLSEVNNPRADLIHSESTHGHVDATYDQEDKVFYPKPYRESIGNSSTEYIPLKLKNKSERDRPALSVSEIDNQSANLIPPEPAHCQAGAKCDSEDKVFHSESYRETIGRGSTEYLMVGELKNYTEYTKPALKSHIAGHESSEMRSECSSISTVSDTEAANCSINATCDTIDKEINFDSYCENHTESVDGSSLSDIEAAICSINATCGTFDKDINCDSYYENRTETTERFGGFSSKEFVTLPTFNESGNPASADYTENESV